MVALEGHTRPIYWRQISWKISRLFPEFAKFDDKFHGLRPSFSPKSLNLTSNFMSATFSTSREIWQQYSRSATFPQVTKFDVKFHVCDLTPMVLKRHQRLKYWRQYSWKKVTTFPPVAKFYVKFHVCDFSPVAKFDVRFHVCDFPSVTKFSVNICPVSCVVWAAPSVILYRRI